MCFDSTQCIVFLTVFCRCRNTHNVEEYLAAKPGDLHFPHVSALTSESPFISPSNADEVMTDAQNPSIDWSTACPVFEQTGECRHGLRCRFLGGHIRKAEYGKLELVINEEKQARTVVTETELNFVTGETLKQIRSKKVPHLPFTLTIADVTTTSFLTR